MHPSAVSELLTRRTLTVEHAVAMPNLFKKRLVCAFSGSVKAKHTYSPDLPFIRLQLVAALQLQQSGLSRHSAASLTAEGRQCAGSAPGSAEIISRKRPLRQSAAIGRLEPSLSVRQAAANVGYARSY